MQGAEKSTMQHDLKSFAPFSLGEVYLILVNYL